MFSTKQLFYLIVLLLCLEDVQSYDSRITLDTTRTNAGPLTTPFVPPSSCFDVHTRLYLNWPRLEIGCQGPYGNDCCPDNWRANVYYSPGVCPSGYYGCTLPTSKQRQETTNLCCPEHFDCAGQHLCTRPLNNRQIITYVDSTVSTQATAYAVTATPIQIRFRAAESTIVPVPTDSLKLPRGYLLTREKVGIGIGVPVAVALLTMVVWGLDLGLPPPYPGVDNGRSTNEARYGSRRKRFWIFRWQERIPQ
ncbi:uncharacterized protein CDV56_103606 [Aspergillus thermomutatus]|uniref:Uncharacterized protein n=1 Tax=Aspergillus thermomutatus TaxID=41047 RepID=A0A397HSC2_ASPTH|nr:uncharacterized protein CDV56_103606 [Aspergillus thermomutatus]RHZ63420.1 hypothetical protein CDV56_103606 [Aspergillus thermomutatus]